MLTFASLNEVVDPGKHTSRIMLSTQNKSSGEKRRNSRRFSGKNFLRRALFVLPVQRRFGIFSIYFPLFRTGRQTHLLKIGWIDDNGGAPWFLILWRVEVKQETRYKKVRVERIKETEKERRSIRQMGRNIQHATETRGADWLNDVSWRSAFGFWQQVRRQTI